MRIYGVLMLACGASAVLTVSDANAEPMFNSNQCNNTSWTGWPMNPSPPSGYSPGDPIYVYIQDDFGTQLQTCLDTDVNNTSEIKSIPTSQVDMLVGNVIQSSAETWNLESRGAALIFGGYVDANDADAACSQMQKPAVFVRFRPRCLYYDLVDVNDIDNDGNTTERIPDVFDLDNDGNTTENTPDVFDIDNDGNVTENWPDLSSCFSGTSGTVNARSINTCGSTIELTMWGDFNSVTEASGCDPSNGGMRTWGLDGEGDGGSGVRDLKDLMVHEFGHVVDLGHPQDLLLNPVGNIQRASVMERGLTSTPFNNTARGRHLFPWDVDCVDDPALDTHRGQRSVRYAWQGFEHNSTPAPSITLHPQQVSKGFMSGGYMRDGSAKTASLYLDDHLSRAYMGSDGYFVHNDQSLFSRDEIENLYYPPVLMSTFEMTGTDQNHRINFASYETQSTWGMDFTPFDPPQIAYIHNDDYFESGVGPDDYEVCMNASCSISKNLQTHIPMVSAWDDVSGITVVVTVNTDRDDTNHGEISVHAGFVDPDLTLIKEGSVLSDNKLPPTATVGDLAYTLKTDVAPAITCAPDDFPWSSQDFNCFLAWVDRGIPNGKILYTHFKIEAGEVVWDNATRASIRGSSNADIRTVSSISAAFFDDTLWLAWKSNDSTPDVLYVKRSSSSWDSQAVRLTRGEVVDPPTWAYTPQHTKESALIWTEIP